MAFATRSKFFWSRFIATCVKYLGVANTQQIRYLAERILPTEMSRQNILYHVRIAEEKGWIATFASALEMTDENEILFRKNFLKKINEKVSAQRFVIIGTETFDPECEDKIIQICKEVNLNSISILDPQILQFITDDCIKRLSSTKEKAIGNQSLFMVLLRFGWFWLNINPEVSLRIINVLKSNNSKHKYNHYYKIDVDLLEIVCMIELETLPELDTDDLKSFLTKCVKLSSAKDRTDIMNLMSMTLLISGRFLVTHNKLTLAEEYLNRGIKYLRISRRKSILMRKLHVDGLFDLGYIYSQQGWFYKALSMYENIELILKEEFHETDPTLNLQGRLALARTELYLMMAYPAYTFQDEDYRSSLDKALNYADKAIHYYQETKNTLLVTEVTLLSAWINALLGRLKRAEHLFKKGTKELAAPVPAKLNAFYYNAQAEIHRKMNNYSAAIKSISLAFDYLKILGQDIGKLFCMTRLAELHVSLSLTENQISYISFGNMSHLFKKEISDMVSHVFLEYVKSLVNSSAIVSFYLSSEVLQNHPEVDNYADYLKITNISTELLGESFTILPSSFVNNESLNRAKAVCITAPENKSDIVNDFIFDNFKDELMEFDDTFQKLMAQK
ncbi:MAG: hypothetical protein FK734_02465 [Asgard group archaeon]|nr:hypothetical protein [Asgard group archaeon]